ncbi:glycosyltransferase 87 family protein [Nonomuraea insulae]|uniref:Glycosyltransferase 87 family protein n=1 Tax=Nonomuraea insulae TaxID=1616787 RepID=A0ABW1CVP4_9ACTN
MRGKARRRVTVPGRRTPIRRLLPVVAWTCAVLVTVAAIAPLVLHWLTNPDDQRLVDLAVYREGGQSFLQGRAIYDYLTPAPQLLPFTYPPVAALLAAPLAALPWPVVQWLWTAGIFACLAVVLAVAFRPFLRKAGQWRPAAFAVLFIASAYLLPMQYQVRFGQVGILLTMLCLLDCTIKAPWWPRGVLIGLATAIKLTPGLFIIYLWITGRRAAAAAAGVTTAMLMLIPFVVIPDDTARFWFGALLDSGRVGANNATTNQSIRGMLLRLYLDSGLTSILWTILVTVVGVIGFRAAHLLWSTRQEIAAVSVVGLLTALLSPVGWIHHYTWIILTIAALLQDGTSARRDLGAASLWLAFTIPIPYLGVAVLAAQPTQVPALVLGKIVQDGYGLIAVGLVVVTWWRLRPGFHGDRSVTSAGLTAY